jgi:hypothetical protein
MGSRFQTSTGAIMLLVVVVALEMVLFREIWVIVFFPPITMIFLAMNLGLFYLLAHPRNLETRIIGMIWGGVAAFLGIVTYQALSPVHGGGGLGLLEPLLEGTFLSWAISVTDLNSPGAMTLFWLSTHAHWIEFALLDALGVVVIWLGGGMQKRLGRRWLQAEATLAPVPLPLDDRAVTPL